MSPSPVATDPNSPTGNDRPPATGLEITAIITAIMVPVVGLVLGIIAWRATSARNGRPSGIAKAATIISSALIVVGVGAIISAVVLVNNAVTEAQNAPFCTAFKNSGDLFSEQGVGSLYEPMYNGDFASFEDRLQQTEAYWNANLPQITAWYDQWMLLAANPPADEQIQGYLEAQAVVLDPSTGPFGPDSPINLKEWEFVRLYAQEVSMWGHENCWG